MKNNGNPVSGCVYITWRGRFGALGFTILIPPPQVPTHNLPWLSLTRLLTELWLISPRSHL